MLSCVFFRCFLGLYLFVIAFISGFLHCPCDLSCLVCSSGLWFDATVSLSEFSLSTFSPPTPVPCNLLVSLVAIYLTNNSPFEPSVSFLSSFRHSGMRHVLGPRMPVHPLWILVSHRSFFHPSLFQYSAWPRVWLGAAS